MAAGRSTADELKAQKSGEQKRDRRREVGERIEEEEELLVLLLIGAKEESGAQGRKGR